MHPALLRTRKSDLPTHEAVLAVAMASLFGLVIVAAIQWHGAQERPILIPAKFSKMIASRIDNGIEPEKVHDVILQLPAARGAFVAKARTVPLTHEEALLCEENRDGEIDITILPMIDGRADVDHLPIFRDSDRIPGAEGICSVILTL
jgi:hypothetical protein